jgi:RNA polymerase sigma factor (sigma-70 family)
MPTAGSSRASLPRRAYFKSGVAQRGTPRTYLLKMQPSSVYEHVQRRFRVGNGPGLMDNPTFKVLRHAQGASSSRRVPGHSQAATDSNRAIAGSGNADECRGPVLAPPASLTMAPLSAGAIGDESFLVSHLPLIDSIIAQVCRRHHLSAGEAEEVSSEIKLRLIERNYEVLRQFQGRSSLRTYLIVVVHRLFLDHRIKLWGKWRPSSSAKRLGPVAILLERLTERDGWTFEQAVEVMRTNHGVDESRDALWKLHVQLPPHTSARHFVSEEACRDLTSPSPSPEANLIRAEQDFVENRVHQALDRALRTLKPEERLIVRMRFADAFQVSEIASVLHLDQKRLYRTINVILARLRERLIADGISFEDVSTLFADPEGARG